MFCNSCNLDIPASKAYAPEFCDTCGNTLKPSTEDLLLHGYNNFVSEVRVNQVALARLVDQALREKRICFAEGAVGIGKSRAYLTPAVLSGKRVVVSTAKKQLQYQLNYKDLPHIKEKAAPDLTYVLRKGKSNYACQFAATTALKRARDLENNSKRARELETFLAWLEQAPTGDDYDYGQELPKFWRDVNAEECIGKTCRFKADCGFWQAKQASQATARVVVANHHLVSYDLKYGPFKILGPYDILIFDEAHQAPDSLRSAYTSKIYPRRLERFFSLKAETGIDVGLDKQLQNEWDTMFRRIQLMDGAIAPDPFGSPGKDVLTSLEVYIKKAASELSDTKAEKAQCADPEFVGSEDLLESEASLMRFLEFSRRVKQDLEVCAAPDKNTLLTVKSEVKRGAIEKSVQVEPVDIGGLVGPKLAQVGTVIVTSATLSVNGDFSDIKRHLGIGSSFGTPLEAVFETPFNYSEQALLYTPKHLPMPPRPNDPGRHQYIQAVANECYRLVAASKGNAFILFSSRSDMRDVHAALEQTSWTGDWILQEENNADAALKQYMATPNSTLLGVKSFWEGVDVAGDKLRLVIIVKLPFTPPDDPLQKIQSARLREQAIARGLTEQQADGYVFSTLSIPKMLTDTRQAAGRLIRTATDRGVLAILDPRIWTGSNKFAPNPQSTRYTGYGKKVVDAIGYTTRTWELVDAISYLTDLVRDSENK